MEKGQFVGNIREWLMCDAQLAKLQQQARELRKKKKELGLVVMNEMENQNLTLLDTGTTHLRIARTKRKQPLTRKYLMDRLAHMFGAGTDACKTAEESLLNSRPVVEHKELKAKFTKT